MSGLRLGLFGASGRMGRQVEACLPEFPQLTLTSAVDVTAGPAARFDDCDVVIDFSVASATEALLQRLSGSQVALVTGVTGRNAAQIAALDERARQAPVLAASNFSVGVALLARLVGEAAARVDWDVEIFELHHRRKADAPSGTALTLGEAAATARQQGWPEARAAVRDGNTGVRAAGPIGVAAGRGGDVVGEHTVFLLGDGERLELTHRATDRKIFARGALRAAVWLAGRPAGRYRFDQIL